METIGHLVQQLNAVVEVRVHVWDVNSERASLIAIHIRPPPLLFLSAALHSVLRRQFRN